MQLDSNMKQKDTGEQNTSIVIIFVTKFHTNVAKDKMKK